MDFTIRNHNIPSVLLIGPTGSGKTPLGNFIEKNGLYGRKCYHFDFGEHLRKLVETQRLPAGLNNNDKIYVRHLLEKGGLLDDDKFYIAKVIITSFILENQISNNDAIILNGLPATKVFYIIH